MKSAKLALLTSLLMISPCAVLAQTEDPPTGEPGELAAQAEEAGLEAQEEKVEFNIGLTGGRVVGTAGDFQYREDLFLLAVGGVELKYKDLQVRADIMRLDLQTELLTAEGEVILDDGPQRLTGETLEYDLATKTGRVTQATAYVDPDYYFSGSQIAKVDEFTYTIDDGVFTSCDQETPSWSIHLSDARITLEEYARIKNARLKFGNVPVLYAPYLVWPATTNRATGLLVPKPGFSDRRGASLDLAYYVTLGRSADTTFFFDASTEGFFGIGNETRYRPSEKSEGYFRVYALSQPDDLYGPVPMPSDEFRPVFEPDRPADDLRWKFELFHETDDLWGRFRGVVNITEYSDFDYLQDFERNIGRQTRSFIYSNAFLTSNFGQHSFNIMADQRERILVQPQEDVRRQLPEVEYRLRPTQLGNTPIYFSLDSAAHLLSIEQTNPGGNQIFDNRYARAHVAPTFSIPVSTLSWLSAKVNLGGRATYYTDSLSVNPETGRAINEFSGDSLERFVADAGLEIVGPVFSRIFDKKLGHFAKVKHIIEPRMTYRFIDDFDEQQQIFRFDEIDNVGTTNAWTFSLFNRLMGKPADPDDGGALEVASIELRQSFSLDDDRPLQRSANDPMLTSKEGPLAALLRINPSRDTSVRLDLRYNTLFNELQSMSFSGGTKIGPHSLGLTWFTNWRVEDSARIDIDPMAPRAGEKTSEQIRLFGKLAILPRRLTFDAEVSYDTIENEIRHQRYFINWNSKCYGWQLELRESIRGTIEDRDIRFALTLKHVGTFLDLNQSL